MQVIRADITANIMADLKRENEAKVEYDRLTTALVVALENYVTAKEWPELIAAVRTLQEWRKTQPRYSVSPIVTGATHEL